MLAIELFFPRPSLRVRPTAPIFQNQECPLAQVALALVVPFLYLRVITSFITPNSSGKSMQQPLESAQELTVTDTKRTAIRNALEALVQFKREFNRDLSASLLAELYVALELDLVPASGLNQQGYDLISADGKRYQVKQRGYGVLNVDVNNFEFDYLVLVNLTDDYRVDGMWRLSVEKARTLFVRRENFRKYQATQKSVKQNGELLSLA